LQNTSVHFTSKEYIFTVHILNFKLRLYAEIMWCFTRSGETIKIRLKTIHWGHPRHRGDNSGA